MKNSILIIGSGPAGLTCGYQISKNKNYNCKIVEISNEVGGMARSINIFDRVVDIGPHRFFSNDTRINKFWLEVVGDEYKMINRLTRIYYKKKFFNYPLKPFNALFNLGIIMSILCVFSYLKYLIFPKKDTSNFSNWITNRFGYKLYSIFFKSYTYKLWGISPDELSSEFAKQRIKDFSLGEAIKQLFKKNNNHKTLVDQFAYPLKGNGYVYKKMKEKFIKNRGDIVFQKKIVSIEKIGDQFIVEYNDNGSETFDYVVSSMPIDNFLDLFENYNGNLPELKFRNTILVYTNIVTENLFEDQWLYIQDENVKTGRITNFNNWVDSIKNDKPGTILVNEYWTNEDDEMWSFNDQKLNDLCIKDLISCGFIKNKSEVIDYKVIRVPKCYPLYTGDYKNELLKVQSFVDSIDGLQLIGRYGSFKYNNQDHSILMGMLSAENIIDDKNNNLWDINTDYKYHESSTISETGLVSNSNKTLK